MRALGRAPCRPNARRLGVAFRRNRVAAGKRRRAGRRRDAATRDRGRRRFLPAARRRAGSGQRRLDPAVRGGRGRRAGAAVEALRIRVVAEGPARGAGRAFLPRHPRGRRPARRGRRSIGRRARTSSPTVAAGGTRLFAAPLAGRVALAIGNEGAGLSAELAARATQRVTIPMPGGVESLNAAAAAAVCLFECVRQRDAANGATAGRR